MGAVSYFQLNHIDDFNDWFTCNLLSLLRVNIPQNVNELVLNSLYARLTQIGVERRAAENIAHQVVDNWSMECNGRNIFEEEVLFSLENWVKKYLTITPNK